MAGENLHPCTGSCGTEQSSVSRQLNHAGNEEGVSEQMKLSCFREGLSESSTELNHPANEVVAVKMLIGYIRKGAVGRIRMKSMTRWKRVVQNTTKFPQLTQRD